MIRKIGANSTWIGGRGRCRWDVIPAGDRGTARATVPVMMAMGGVCQWVTTAYHLRDLRPGGVEHDLDGISTEKSNSVWHFGA